MSQFSNEELQRIIRKAKTLVEHVIREEIKFESFVSAIEDLTPDGSFFFREGDARKVLKDIFCSMKIERIIHESPINACVRQKNYEVANYLLKMLSEK